MWYWNRPPIGRDLPRLDLDSPWTLRVDSTGGMLHDLCSDSLLVIRADGFVQRCRVDGTLETTNVAPLATRNLMLSLIETGLLSITQDSIAHRKYLADNHIFTDSSGATHVSSHTMGVNDMQTTVLDVEYRGYQYHVAVNALPVFARDYGDSVPDYSLLQAIINQISTTSDEWFHTRANFRMADTMLNHVR